MFQPTKKLSSGGTWPRKSTLSNERRADRHTYMRVYVGSCWRVCKRSCNGKDPDSLFRCISTIHRIRRSPFAPSLSRTPTSAQCSLSFRASSNTVRRVEARACLLFAVSLMPPKILVCCYSKLRFGGSVVVLCRLITVVPPRYPVPYTHPLSPSPCAALSLLYPSLCHPVRVDES